MKKLKLSKKNIILVLIPLILVLIISTQIKLPVYSVDYHGIKLKFRANLRDAEKVLVYPNEKDLQGKFLNKSVKNITIVFKPGNETVNAYYATEVFEIAYKLTVAYRLNFGYIPNFSVINVTDYENWKGSFENPIIILVHPIYSNQTSIKVEDHVVYIQGKDVEGFDLATIKFLMVTLNIKI